MQKYTLKVKRPSLLGAKCPYMRFTILQVGILSQSCDYSDTGYFKSIQINDMEMQVIFQIIFVMNFNRMHKAIFQCKTGKLLGIFGNMTRSIMGKMLTGTD